MVAQDLVEPSGGGEKIEDPVHLRPLTANVGKREFRQFLYIPVQCQVPAVSVIVLLQKPADESPVGLKIIPLPKAHVKIADDEDFAAMRKIQHRVGVEALAYYI